MEEKNEQSNEQIQNQEQTQETNQNQQNLEISRIVDEIVTKRFNDFIDTYLSATEKVEDKVEVEETSPTLEDINNY